MNKKISFAVVVVVIASLAILGWHTRGTRMHDSLPTVTIAGKQLKVEIAATSEAQTKGLSGRKSLPEDEGMLFAFEVPGKYYFWMKDMNFAIDMIWIGENEKVIYIKENAEPEDALTTFGPDKDSKYVLEVNAGFSKENKLKVGDKVEFTY